MAKRTYPIADGMSAWLRYKWGDHRAISKAWRRSARRIEGWFMVWDPLHDVLGLGFFTFVWNRLKEVDPNEAAEVNDAVEPAPKPGANQKSETGGTGAAAAQPHPSN